MRVRLGNFQLGVTRTWFVAQALCVLGFSVLAYWTVLGHLGARLTPLSSLWVGLVLLVALDLTIVVHEAGHAVAAMLAGVRVRAVLFVAYGGATIREASPDRRVDRWTAAAGPLANFAAAGACALVLACLPSDGGLSATVMVAAALQAVNGLVNLAPLARCDGARIFG